MTIAKMATRIPSNLGPSQDHCTEFQLHKSQIPEFDAIRKKIVDFTEHKMLKYISTIEDVQQKTVLVDLLAKYRRGAAAIAWKRGRPIFCNVNKEK